MRIGIISDSQADTGLDAFGPEFATFFSSVDLILHAGNIQAPVVLDWLEQFAPLLCLRSNHDGFDDRRLNDLIRFEREGWRIGANHVADDDRTRSDRVEQLKRQSYGGTGLDILIAGDSHYERLEYVENTLLLNPGSALLPHQYGRRLGAVALLELTADRGHAEILRIGETLNLPNPSHIGHIDFDRRGPSSASFDNAPIKIQRGVVVWPGALPSDQL